MKTYARIDSGFEQPTVVEIIQPAIDSAGMEVPVTDRFTDDFVKTLADITNVDPQPACWWTGSKNGDSWVFSAPKD